VVGGGKKRGGVCGGGVAEPVPIFARADVPRGEKRRDILITNVEGVQGSPRVKNSSIGEPVVEKVEDEGGE